MKIYKLLSLLILLLFSVDHATALTIKGYKSKAGNESFLIEAYDNTGRSIAKNIKTAADGSFEVTLQLSQPQLFWVDGAPIFFYADDTVELLLPEKKLLSTSANNPLQVKGTRSEENLLIQQMMQRWQMIRVKLQQDINAKNVVDSSFAAEKQYISSIAKSSELRSFASNMAQYLYLDATIHLLKKQPNAQPNDLFKNLKNYDINNNAIHSLRQVMFIGAVDHAYVLSQLKKGRRVSDMPQSNFSVEEKIRFVIESGKTSRLLNDEVVQSIINHLSLQGIDGDMAKLIKNAKAKITDPTAMQKLDTEVSKYINVANNSKAPLFVLPDKKGNMVDLSQLNGKVVAIDVWATWCAPCMQTLPKFLEMRKKYQNNPNIVFLTISIDDEKVKDKWLAFLNEKQMNGLDLFAQGSFKSDYAVNAIPRYIIIGKDGKIVDGHAPHAGDPNFERIINNLL